MEHLGDARQVVHSLELLGVLVRRAAIRAVGLRGLVGVEPCGHDSLTCGKLGLLGELLFGGRALVGVVELGKTNLVARGVGGKVVVGIVAVLAADALDDIDRSNFCYS